MAAFSSVPSGLALLLLLTCTFSEAKKDPPKQIHLAPANTNGTAVFVSFVTAAEHVHASVEFGLNPDVLNLTGTLSEPPLQYDYQSKYMDEPYTSPFIYHFVLSPLQPSTRYFYQCNSTKGAAAVRSFVTAPAVAPDSPTVFGVVGDLGQVCALSFLQDGLWSFLIFTPVSRIHFRRTRRRKPSRTSSTTPTCTCLCWWGTTRTQTLPKTDPSPSASADPSSGTRGAPWLNRGCPGVCWVNDRRLASICHA